MGGERPKIVLQSMERRDTRDNADRPECSDADVRRKGETKPISLGEEVDNLLQDLEGFENQTGGITAKESAKRLKSFNSEDKNFSASALGVMEEAHSLSQESETKSQKKKGKRVTFSDKNDIQWFETEPSTDEADSVLQDFEEFEKVTKNARRKRWKKIDFSSQEAQTSNETEAKGVMKEAEKFNWDSEAENINSDRQKEFRFLKLEYSTCDETSTVLEEAEAFLHFPKFVSNQFKAESLSVTAETDNVLSEFQLCESEGSGMKKEEKSTALKRHQELQKTLKSSQGHFEGELQAEREKNKLLHQELEGVQETCKKVRLDHQIMLRFYKQRVELLERELQQQISLNKLVKIENRELQKALNRSQRNVAAELHRLQNNGKYYEESILFAKSSQSLWRRLRHFLGLRKPQSWKF